MTLVQIILGIALLICLIIGAVFFAKASKGHEGKKAIMRFTLIESALFILTFALLLVSFKSAFSVWVYLITAALYTFFANIPIGLIAALLKVFFKNI